MKNLIELIYIYRKFQNDGLDIRLSLIGDGNLKPQILESLGIFESKYWWVLELEPDFKVLLENINIYGMTYKLERILLSFLEVALKGSFFIVNSFNRATDFSKHAYWVGVAKTFEKEDFYFLLKDFIIKKTVHKKIHNKKLLKLRQYFFLERMSNQILEFVEND